MSSDDPQTTGTDTVFGRVWSWLVAPLLLAGLVGWSFAPALDAGFVDWDDGAVLVENERVRSLDREHLEWMFRESKMGHYQPLTWLSYALEHAWGQARFEELAAEDQARYVKGLDPRSFHGTNILLHVGVALALYGLGMVLLGVALKDGPGSPGRTRVLRSVAAWCGAALFACHPLRVESVAWVTERRDVLSSFFLVPAVTLYVVYARRSRTLGGGLAYLAALVLLALSLLSKAWGITVPGVLLILDVYPLRRIGGDAGWSARRVGVLLVEKLPFIGLAVWFAWRASAAQRGQLDGVPTLAEWSVLDRVGQACYGLGFYVHKTLLPLGLNPLVERPVDNDPFAARYVVSAAVVLCALVWLVCARRRLLAVCVACSAYVWMLSPVLGFHQAGPQLVADRYSYLATMPFALLLAGALALGLARRRAAAAPWVVLLAGGLLAGVLGFAARAQSRVWHDSHSLWSHVLARDPDCRLALLNLGTLEWRAGRIAAATELFRAGLELEPDNTLLLNNLAVAVRGDKSRPRRERLLEARGYSERAVALLPGHSGHRVVLGGILVKLGEYDAGIAQLREGLRLRERFVGAAMELGEAYRLEALRGGNLAALPRAREHYLQALEWSRALHPRSGDVIRALKGLASVSAASGDSVAAARYYHEVLAIVPGDAPARAGLEELGQ